MEKIKNIAGLGVLYGVVAVILFGVLGAGVGSVVGGVALFVGSVFIAVLVAGWFDKHWITKQ